MKKTILLAFLFVSCGLLQAQLYVNHSAIGANDGTSWDNAYTDLQSALDDSSDNTIWIAAGIYTPGAGSLDTFSTFNVNRPVNIFGGFAGTETSQDDRVIDSNPTIISGDLARDDVFGNNFINREDNSVHVMLIDSSAEMVIIDALTVTGGTNLAFNDSIDIPLFLRRGAGIYSEARVSISRCDFTGNYGGSGVGLLLLEGITSNSIVQNCRFYKNTAFDQATFYILRTQNIEVKDCQFFDNAVNRGALYPSRCNNITVTNCEFNDNINDTGSGGGMFNWHTRNLTIQGCTFSNNSATNGGGIYGDYRDFPLAEQEADNMLIKDCNFNGNFASSWGGGAVRTFTGSLHLLNCNFTNNTAASTGGAVNANGDAKRLTITDCTFEGNNAGGGWGGGLTIYGDSTFAVVKGTTFKGNEALTSGGGATAGFGANVTYEDCIFDTNTARFGGGTYAQSDYTSLTYKNTTFFSNTAEVNGAGAFCGGGQNVTVENCSFEGNQSSGIAGGFSMGEDSLDLSTLNLTNTIFNFNLAATQGGGLNIGNANSNIANCLFVNNIANEIGTGGAISMNASGPNELTVKMTNNTLADNFGELAAGIATWTEDSTAATLFLQNNAFTNGFSNNYGVEAGNTLVVSLGGNFSNNNTTDGIFDATLDLSDSKESPSYADAASFDYHILEGSPFIEAGVSAGAPPTDLDGNGRTGQTDIGAYEFQGNVSTKDIIEDDKNLKLTPNPVVFQTTLTVDNDWKGEFELDIININGQLLERKAFSKTSEKQDFAIRVNHLPKGSYYLVLKNGNQTISKRMIKL